MPDGDDLDRRLRRAFGAVTVEASPAPARQAMLSGLRRRRARRHRVLAGSAVAVLAAAAVAVGLSSSGSPDRSAAPPAHRPAPPTPHRPSLAPSLGGSAGPGCAEVRVGGARATCAGSYSTSAAGTFSAARPAASPPSAAVNPADGAIVNGSAAVPPEELSVGESLTVDLPADGTFVWGALRVEQSTAAGVGKGPVIEVVRSTGGRPGARATASVRALRPGVADLEATAGAACRRGKRACEAVELVWTLHVTVEGR